MHLGRRGPWITAGVALALAGATLQSCGGGDDESASDADYVKAVCGALATFNENRDELTAGAGTAEPDKVAEDFAKLIRELRDGLDDANPPDDASDAHESMVDALSQAADAVEDGGVVALFDVELPTVALAPDVRSRLQLVFNTTPECAGSDSIFS